MKYKEKPLPSEAACLDCERRLVLAVPDLVFYGRNRATA
jgi:hypothetical protein